MKKHMFGTSPVRPHSIGASPVRVRHRRDVVRWALERKHPLDRDALAALVATRLILPDGSISTRWSVADVDSVIGWGIDNWCHNHGTETPSRLCPTLDTYFRYLGANKLLDPRSDQLSLLRRAVAENASALGNVSGAGPRRARSDRSAHPSLKPSPRLAPVVPIG